MCHSQTNNLRHWRKKQKTRRRGSNAGPALVQAGWIFEACFALGPEVNSKLTRCSSTRISKSPETSGAMIRFSLDKCSRPLHRILRNWRYRVNEVQPMGGRRSAMKQLAGIGTLLAMAQVRAAER